MDVWAATAEELSAAPDPGGPDVWANLTRSLDPAELRPQMGEWVQTRRFEARGGRDHVMVANTRDLIYYRLEPAEADLLALMDGTRTTSEILVEHLRDAGELDVSAVVELIRSLEAGGFLTDRYVDVDAAVTRALAPSGLQARLATFFKTLSVEWSGAERLTLWLHRHGLRYLFTRVGMIAAAVIAVTGFVAFGAVAATGRFEFTPQSVGVGFAILFTLNLVLVFIHELGHAALLVHYGRRVKSSGIRIYFGTPAFFIDSSDVLMLSRGKRIAQSFAGPYFEMVATGVAALALWAWPDGSTAQILYRFVILNYFVLLLNLVPMLELDGYWILSDALRVPDLRPRSLAFMRRDLWAKLRHRERFSASEIGIGLYGTVGVAFTVVCLVSAGFFWRSTFGGLVTKMWDAGPLGIALLAVLVAFLAGPLLRVVVELVRSVSRAVVGLWRRASFRAQRAWRIEAASLLDTLPIFDDLPAAVLSDIAGRVTLRRAHRETTIVRAGERADAFYLVRSGRLEVVETDPDTHATRVLRIVNTGESFGELGLATGALRNATVRAITDVELFAIDKGTFDRLLADRIQLPDIAPTLQALTELRALPTFATLGTDELAALRERGKWQSIAPDQTVITQGETGDAFYAIGAGRLDVIQDGQTVAHLEPGAYFGEVALLADIPRTATVRAVTPARVFRLDRTGFDLLLADAFHRGRLPTNLPATFVRE